MGIKDISEKVNEMLTIDYLIGNTDRHWKNFAVLRDTNTLQYIKFAPIYDNDRAFDYSSDNNYMVGTMTVDKIKNIVKENKITKWTYEEFAEKIKPILEIDTKDQHNINDIYNIICKKYYLLIQKISY